MIIGTLRLRLIVRESRSLKDKRQVVRSIKDRLRNAFPVSVAEVDELDHRQIAVLGLALVGNERPVVQSVLDQIVDAVRSHPVAELLDYSIEV
jgi:uncharacterized protein YlxP (DUF503 family)